MTDTRPAEPRFARNTRTQKRDDEYRECQRRISMFIPRRTSTLISGIGPGDTAFVGAAAVLRRPTVLPGCT
jgi:hypothetical protein